MTTGVNTPVDSWMLYSKVSSFAVNASSQLSQRLPVACWYTRVVWGVRLFAVTAQGEQHVMLHHARLCVLLKAI